jgi:hypothetical protein
VCAALLIPAAGAVAEGGTGGPRPVIVVAQTSQDAGTMEEGSEAPFRFTVINRGQADLEIAQVKPSCGCTIPKWDRVIKPGAQGTIEARMNTQYFRGTVTKHLTVVSNDPDRPQVELAITAHVTPLVKISPDPDALLVVKDKPVTQTFTLERSGGRPMKVLQVISYAPYLKAETRRLPGEGRCQLTVTAAPDAPLGRSKAAVVVWTDMPQDGALTFYLTVDRGIVPIPPAVFYGILPHELTTPQQATVTIVRNSAPFHVKSAAVSDPHLSSQLETVRDGAEYRVTVTYTGGWETGRRQQTLTVTTDDPKQPVIEVPVQAIVQARVAKAPGR